MSLAPYYTGDNVPLKFTVSGKGGGINPLAAKVIILTPNAPTEETNATIDGNTVSYTVPTSVTDKSGRYKAYFVLTLPSGIRTHKIEFKVKTNAEGNR